MKYLIYLFCLIIFWNCNKKSADKTSQIVPDIKAYKDEIFSNIFKKNTGWIAADGAWSIALDNGKSLWSFGDSYIDNYDVSSNTVPCLFQVRNSALTIDNVNPQNQTLFLGTLIPKSFYKNSNDSKVWLWGGNGYQEKDTVYVFLSEFSQKGAGVFDIGFNKNIIVKLNPTSMKIYTYQNLINTMGIDFSFGVIKEDQYVYIYGSKRVNAFSNELYLARYQGLVPKNWQYFDGSNWVIDISKIKAIDNRIENYSIQKIDKNYVKVFSDLSTKCNEGKKIYFQTSIKPEGPFSNKKELWQIDDLDQGNSPVFYQAHLHPQMTNSKSEVLLTYCINGYSPCVASCKNNRFNPEFYRPRGIRVPIEIFKN